MFASPYSRIIKRFLVLFVQQETRDSCFNKRRGLGAYGEYDHEMWSAVLPIFLRGGITEITFCRNKYTKGESRAWFTENIIHFSEV